jgi:CubicO group peptidase (beta-lactamase class C family)
MRLFLMIACFVMATNVWSSTPRAQMEEILFGSLPEIQTDAFLILKDGNIVYERYARGYNQNSKHLSWSMGKTIAGIIAAQAIDEGHFKMSDSLELWLPKYKGAATVLNLFQMSSGIQFKEEYSGIPVDSDATRMLYLDGPKIGFADYTISLPLRSNTNPSEHFYYSSGDAHLIMETMKNSFNNKDNYNAYPWTKFFDRLGINNATFEQDSSETFVGSSYVYMTPIEYARIGLMLSNNGKWNNEQIIPSWYFKLMSEVNSGVMEKALPGTSQTRAYSMQTTTNLPITKRNIPSEYPNLPEDALLMIGHQGQLVIASPSEKLVIVRLATDKGDPFNPHRQELFSTIRTFLGAEKGITIHGAGDINGQPVPRSPVVIPEKIKSKAKITDYLKLPKLIRALYAKELCSCIFVLNRTVDQCHADLKLSLPILPFSKINRDNLTVSTTFTKISHSKAIFKGARLGCTLVK